MFQKGNRSLRRKSNKLSDDDDDASNPDLYPSLTTARHLLNEMYDETFADFDVTSVDCDEYDHATTAALNENMRLQTIQFENAARARSMDIEANNVIDEAEDEL